MSSQCYAGSTPSPLTPLRDPRVSVWEEQQPEECEVQGRVTILLLGILGRSWEQ